MKVKKVTVKEDFGIMEFLDCIMGKSDYVEEETDMDETQLWQFMVGEDE